MTLPRWSRHCGCGQKEHIITDSADTDHLLRAVDIATWGPRWGGNPRVGCVLVRDGEILSEGFHRGAGTPHAEVDAIDAARVAGREVAGATAYVTLEPCRHTGKTPPCTQALVEAGIAEVVYAVPDPHPTAGGGAAELSAAGVLVRHVECAPAQRLNARWLRSVQLGRPYVIAKWAATLDGRIAAHDGSSFWITGPEARDLAHQSRAEVDAIVVGTGTVARDNPLLSARPSGIDHPHQPLRVIMGMRDTSGSHVWRDDNCVAVHSHRPQDVLDEIYSRGMRTVLVEGGAAVLSAFVRARLVDEFNVYIAPAVLGRGPSPLEDVGIDTMSEVFRGQEVSVTSIGMDTLITVMVEE